MSQDFSKTFATLAYSLRPQIDQELAKEMESYVVKVGAILQSWEAIAEFNGSLQGKRRGEQYVCRSVGCLLSLFKENVLCSTGPNLTCLRKNAFMNEKTMKKMQATFPVGLRIPLILR